MARFKDEEILGLLVGEGCVCKTCLTAEEISNMELGRLITERDLDKDEVLFCDRCGKQIVSL